ncbi:MAG: tRNA (adenosine(37)-N6)-threonylcarbamoyltransferase complex dimerization subunit type 1 TsaB [Actinomycetales bacterium]
MLLALDTSAAVSVALLDHGRVLASRHAYDPRKHAELLSPFVQEVLGQAGVGLDEVDTIAVGQGPGPFTGLRVGLVTARVLAYANELVLHGLISLDGLAEGAATRLPPGDFELIAATDARRREVYWARYLVRPGRQPERVDGPHVGPASGIEVGAAVCVGRGTLLYPEHLPPAVSVEALAELDLLDPTAADIGVVANRELADPAVAGLDGPRDPQPAYLRRPDVTEPVSPAAATPALRPNATGTAETQPAGSTGSGAADRSGTPSRP